MTSQVLCNVRARLGESPLWSAAEQALYWVDVADRTIWRYSWSTGETRSYPVARIPSAIALSRHGRLFVAFRNGLGWLDTRTGREEPIPIQFDFARERFNDAKCDRSGRFVVGTMDKELTAPVGKLYQIDAHVNVNQLSDAVTISNGIAWSPDGSRMYHCDSSPALVNVYDYDTISGRVSNRSIHIDLSKQGLVPDGCTVDAGGNLWVAETHNQSIGCYDPHGNLTRRIKFPNTCITSLIFAGPEMDQIIATTIGPQIGKASNPMDGFLMKVNAGVTGIPEALLQSEVGE